ncbi:TRAP transporter substrate-binding protein [Tepidamorphus sp. 3E244]|uniref:TRAP transporter substrate-binding protein n=1 Tax=Tepidamorphus sp. 3E244 TaxID=3385498 RepID=UPI0038FC65C3
MTLSRRNLLTASAAGAASLASPAVVQAQETRNWRMVTSWPKNLPGPGVTAERLAQRITAASGGALNVTVYAAGEIVPPLEVFDAVQSGTAQMAHTASFFWQGRLPASVFYTAIPFGLTAPEHAAWILHGGGQDLWDELYAPSGIKPFMGGNTGMQMGGWFRKEINGLDDFKGLKMRMPGLGGAILAKLGGASVSLPPGDIYGALQSGLVDAAEFLGPWSDFAQGFYRVAPYYYAPGWHEPNGTGECLVSLQAYEALPDDLKAIVSDSCAAENALSVAESDWENAQALRTLVDEYDVKLRTFPEDVITAAREASVTVLDEAAAKDEMFAKILKSYRAAKTRLTPWTKAGTETFLAARGDA